MHKSRRNLAAREKNKCPLMQPGVRKSQGCRIEDEVVEKKKIEIQGPRPPAHTPLPTGITLNAKEELEERVGRKTRVDLGYRIKI